MNFVQKNEIVTGSDHQSYFLRYLYAAGDITFQRCHYTSPQIQENVYTEKNFRKYFGKKLKSLANSSKNKIVSISTYRYRCKALKTLKFLTRTSMKSPIISLKQLEVISRKSGSNKIVGYKNIASLKIGAFSFDMSLAFVRQMKKFVHLRSLSFPVAEHSLERVTRYILDLRSLRHLDIKIMPAPSRNSVEEAIMRDFYFTLVKSKTLSYLKLKHITQDSNALTSLLQTLSQTGIPRFHIDITCQKDYNVDSEILEAGLRNVDLFIIERYPYLVSLSTNQENPYQTIAKAQRKLKLHVPDSSFQTPKYVPRPILCNSGTTKDVFDLTESLKLLFCNTLSPSFSLSVFNTSKIQCVKTIRVSCEPLQEDKTLEGFKNLQSIIQNSPSLEHFEMNDANFSQREVVGILDELAKLQHLETLAFNNAKFHCNPENEYKKTLPSFLILKKMSLGFSDVRMDDLPFDFGSSKNLTELVMKYPSLKDDDGEKLLKIIKKLSNLEKITMINMPFFSHEIDITRFIQTMSQLTKLKEIYLFTTPNQAISADKAVVPRISKNLHEKVIELFKENKSIEKFIAAGNLFEIKCIRY